MSDQQHTDTTTPKDTTMSETTTTDQPVTDVVEPEATTTDTPEPEDKPGREAAKYRRQLREAEAERDTLATRLEQLQRAEVERIVGERVSKPGAIWAAGAKLEDMLDADGGVDVDKVREATVSASEALGLVARVGTPKPDMTQGARGSHAQPSGWAAAMKL